MPKYLVQANYTSDGLKGLLKEGGAKRKAVVDEMVTSAGGKVEAFYYAFGNTDLYAILEMPDNVTIAALSMAVGAAGAATSKVTVLLAADEIDEAAKITTTYQPPSA